jgi:hypothetical protein
MSKEVMKLALSTLEGWANYDDWVWPESALEQAKRNTIEAITALRQALEAEQNCGQVHTTPSKREWVGLTEKEVKAIANKRNDYGLPMTGRMWVFVADLTDKLKEKNHG